MLAFPPNRRFFLIVLTVCLSVILPSSAGPKGGPVKTIGFTPKVQPVVLDTIAIRNLYLDGDFDQAIEIMDVSLKEKRAFSHADSVFIFKHLGVMYAAKYETREKGKYFMHQLLAVEPTARIMDMYASDMIYMIFKNIQDEFESSRLRLDRAESHLVGNNQIPEPDKPIKKNIESPRSHQAYYWVGASSVLLVAGVATYYVVASQPRKTIQENHPVLK